jgi:hypothetical protein
MKRVIHRIKALGDKATQLKTAVEGAPAVAAGIRDAVAVTASQLRQLRADVQTGVSGLRVEDEDRLIDALREVSAGTDVFEQAGFELSGVDVELGLLRRIVVRLERFEEVSVSRLRSIHAASAGQSTLQALLNALIKAEEMASKVELPDLTYRQLIVDVGPAPTVRVCWRPDTAVVDAEPAAPKPVSAAPTTVPPVASGTPSVFGGDSFFEPRPASTAYTAQPAASSPGSATVVAATMPGPAGPTQTASVPAGAPAPVPVTTGVTTKTGDWKRGALDRFKKMPDLSKPRH